MRTDKSKLLEIKKGEEGYGLLIENDGYISSEVGDNKKLFEDINSHESSEICPEHFIVSAVFQKFGIENANGRIYPESVLKREVERYMSNKVNSKNAIGELNHPSESVIDLDRVSMNIIELHWENSTLVGKMEIITSPGFRKYGIISCRGDQAANLLLSGIKIGVSSRGLGSVTQKMGVLYVSDDYEIVCWDIVSDPSTPNAWITPEDNIPQQYIESKQTKKTKLVENLEEFRDWLID